MRYYFPLICIIVIPHPIQPNVENTDFEKIISLIRSAPEGNDEAVIAVLKAASASIAIDLLKSEQAQEQNFFQITKQNKKSRLLKFTPQEIEKMPKTFRKEFRTQGCTAHVYRMRSGKKTWCYVIRYRKNGYYIVASSTSLEEAKKKFILKLNEADKFGGKSDNSIPETFSRFAEYYFENFYKRKVTASTHRIALNQFKNHIAPYFKDVKLKSITPAFCQNLIDNLEEQGKGKTADDVFSLLNMIFKAAIKHGVIPGNPMDMVFHKKHEQEHGKALTKAEEKMLLERTAGTPQHLMFAIALYTGMRPNEYETARLNGEFIVANNSKRKNGKVELKKIPITPMLKPYLEGVTQIKFSSLRIMRDRFNKIFPGHRLYDLRTTFYTRCQECGVLPAARDEFVGHSLGALGNAYTDLSDEFLLSEGQKLDYKYV